MKKVYITLSLIVLLQACTANRVVEVKSPCVSADGGPCGPKHPINTWLKSTSVKV